MKQTLVTGGAGFIGTHLVRLLVGQGRRVRVLEHPKASLDHLPLAKIEIVRADIRDREAVDQAVQGCEAVFHSGPPNPQIMDAEAGPFSSD